MTIFPQDLCPHCGQKMAGSMFGVYFTPGRIRVLKLIIKCPGISSGQLAERLYGADNKSTRDIVRNTIARINDLLIHTDYSISRNLKARKKARYWLIDINQSKPLETVEGLRARRA